MFQYLFNSICSYFIIYTKIFQWTNIKQNIIFGDQIFNFLKIFTNKAPYNELDINKKVLHEIKDVEIIYPPINSGTISLVFKGTYENKDIILKLKRNGIDKKINNALYNLEYFSKILKFFKIPKTLHFNDFISGVKKTFNKQTNFIEEINNIDYFYENVNNRLIDTTYVYKELSDNDLIVMSYINGISLYDLPEEDKEKCLILFSRTLIYLILEKHIIHLDCHPGNLLFIKQPNNSYKICYIDLGLMLIITNMEEMNFIFDFLKSTHSGNVENVINTLEKYKNCIFIKYNEENLFYLFNDMRNNKLYKTNNSKEIINSTTKLIELTGTNNIIFTDNICNTILMLLTFLGVIRHLDVNDKFGELITTQLEVFEN